MQATNTDARQAAKVATDRGHAQAQDTAALIETYAALPQAEQERAFNDVQQAAHRARAAEHGNHEPSRRYAVIESVNALIADLHTGKPTEALLAEADLTADSLARIVRGWSLLVGVCAERDAETDLKYRDIRPVNGTA